MTFPDLCTVDAEHGQARPRWVPDLDAPIPKQALEDLIALCRALFLAYKAAGPGHDAQLTRLTQIGTKLARVLEKAERGGPGTWNHRTAWLMAEEATAELGRVVDVFLPAKALITASAGRIIRAKATRIDK